MSGSTARWGFIGRQGSPGLKLCHSSRGLPAPPAVRLTCLCTRQMEGCHASRGLPAPPAVRLTCLCTRQMEAWLELCHASRGLPAPPDVSVYSTDGEGKQRGMAPLGHGSPALTDELTGVCVCVREARNGALYSYGGVAASNPTNFIRVGSANFAIIKLVFTGFQFSDFEMIQSIQTI